MLEKSMRMRRLGNFLTPSATLDEIPIHKDAVTRFVPWIMGMLVFLLSLVLTGAFSLNSSLKNWQVGIRHKLTVEVPLQHELDRERIIPNLVHFLQSQPGVKEAQAVTPQQLLSLLEPWVGQVETINDVPMPALIDVDLDSSVSMDLQDLLQKLREYVAGVRIEPHGRWIDTLSLLKSALQGTAYLFAFVIGIAVATTVVLVTRAGLASHHGNISILRLMGANNLYIASKFQSHALALSAKGATIGFVLAVPILLSLSYFLSSLGIPEALCPKIDPGLLITLSSIPLLVVGLSLVVARMAVLRALSLMDKTHESF